MAIYLGSTLISSNPTGTGALYLGSLNICDAYLENTQVFDNCVGANTSVVLTVDVNGITGSTSDGIGPYTLGGNLTGTVKSGQPGTAFTAFNTTISLGANNAWQPGSPTISGQVGGTFPATGSIARTTTISGTTNYQPPVTSGTYTLQETGSAGPGVTFSVSPSTSPQTGTINTFNYSWDITATLGSQYNATSAVLINGNTVISAGAVGPASGSFDVTGLITQSSDIITATYSGGSVLRTYTYSFSLTNSISNTTASQSVSNLSSGASASGPSGGTITITGPAGSTWDMNGSATPNSGYEWSTGSQPASANQTVSATMPANTTGSTTITLTGTTILINTDVTVTLNITDNISGGASNYTIATSGGDTRTGSAPSTYTFTTTVTPNSGYNYSGGNAPVTTSGTYPASSSNVYETLTGTVSRPTLYSVDRSASPGGCGVFQGSSYWWPDPLGYLTGSSEANDVAPSGTQVYADSNYGSYSSTAGTYSITEPNTGADMTQYISSTGTVGTDNSCP